MRVLKLTVLGAVGAILAMSAVGDAAAQSEQVRYSWTAPATGSDPVLYRVEIRFAPAPETAYGPWGELKVTDKPEVVLSFDIGRCYQVRVRAEDAAGLRGGYSEPSVPYCPGYDLDAEPEEDPDPLPPEEISGPIPIGK